MPRTNREKKNKGIENVKEVNPREKEFNTFDEVLEDIEQETKLVSVKPARPNGIVPECLGLNCTENKAVNFYMSFNPIHAKHRVYPFCKQCMIKVFNAWYKVHPNISTAVWYTCMKFDIGYIPELLDGISNDHHGVPFGAYMGFYNSKMKFNNWAVSFDYSKENLLKLTQVKRDEVDLLDEYDDETINWKKEDRQNKKDIIRIYGYDIFEEYMTEDKRKLYNMLVDFLDEATIQDNFKKLAVIQIVKNMLFIENISKEAMNLDTLKNAKDMKLFIDTKNSLMKSNLDIAKDNGISLNHSHNKSKGAGTLGSMLKDLQEKRIWESDVNLFDIETLGGMMKVMEKSDRNIINQLALDENTYTEMLNEQRKLLTNATNERDRLEEELRLLKIKLKEKEVKEEKNKIKEKEE